MGEYAPILGGRMRMRCTSEPKGAHVPLMSVVWEGPRRFLERLAITRIEMR
jgi:hypothetical protein